MNAENEIGHNNLPWPFQSLNWTFRHLEQTKECHRAHERIDRVLNLQRNRYVLIILGNQTDTIMSIREIFDEQGHCLRDPSAMKQDNTLVNARYQPLPLFP